MHGSTMFCISPHGLKGFLVHLSLTLIIKGTTDVVCTGPVAGVAYSLWVGRKGLSDYRHSITTLFLDSDGGRQAYDSCSNDDDVLGRLTLSLHRDWESNVSAARGFL